MKALAMILAGGVAALATAAPAAAQYYPAPPPPPAYGGYGYNQQALVGQCEAAVQQRLGGGYAYGYRGGYGGGRVLGVSRVQPRPEGGLTVRGVATSGRYGGYGYGALAAPDLTWRCATDFRGVIVNVDVRPAVRNYGYGYQPYQPYAPQDPYDYSQYGYRRY